MSQDLHTGVRRKLRPPQRSLPNPTAARGQNVIREYAERRGMTLVRTYADAGERGLRIDGRDALAWATVGECGLVVEIFIAEDR